MQTSKRHDGAALGQVVIELSGNMFCQNSEWLTSVPPSAAHTHTHTVIENTTGALWSMLLWKMLGHFPRTLAHTHTHEHILFENMRFDKFIHILFAFVCFVLENEYVKWNIENCHGKSV